MADPKPISPEEFALDICVPSMYREALITTITSIDSALRLHNVRGCAICGTLLGAIRHGSTIPWDDDGDFLVLENDSELFYKKVIPELMDKGYSLKEMSPTWVKVFAKETPLVGRLRVLGNVTCDIFLFCAEDDERGKRLVPCDECIRVDYPNIWFNEDEVFPVELAKFSSTRIQIPHRPLPFLNRMYPRWAVECVVGGHDPLTKKSAVYCKASLKDVRRWIKQYPE